jgi:predicted TIM-barrel fold metal-dependent hydrolase
MKAFDSLSRRAFLAVSAGCAAGLTLKAAGEDLRIIDIHQHTNYGHRTDDQLVAHQRKMGVTKTNLLPGAPGMGVPDISSRAVNIGENDTCINLSRRYPKEFVYFANARPDLPTTREVLEKTLKMGALGIGEQKFHVDCDSSYMQLVFTIAQEHRVPVTIHLQHDTFNLHIERLHTMLDKFPGVKFIGHAQAWWSNIDRNSDQATEYPTGKVTSGGISDRLLSDYPNMYGDLSAKSGLNSMLRDEDHARDFLKRHQDKLMFGSDCTDSLGEGPTCLGAQIIAAVRRLAPDPKIQQKIFNQNATKVFKITLDSV